MSQKSELERDPERMKKYREFAKQMHRELKSKAVSRKGEATAETPAKPKKTEERRDDAKKVVQ